MARSAILLGLLAMACGSSSGGDGDAGGLGDGGGPGIDAGSGPDARPIAGVETEPLATFAEPWAMTFLPDGRLLVTEKQGALKLVALDGTTGDVSGVPQVDAGGQGGLGDVVLHPDHATNDLVYLSWVEAGGGDTRGAVVGRARLVLGGDDGALEDLEVVWRQTPKVTGRGHFGHRIAFSPDGELYITSGDRQHFSPAQDLEQNLGKVVRLDDEGAPLGDNPFVDDGEIAAEVWSLGHRNPLGIAFAPDGKLWVHEMGPEGGDELNLIVRASNYGWPEVSNGDHYGGEPIPDHASGDGFDAPEVSWTPVIAPAGFVIYTGDELAAWHGSGLIGGLASEALVRVAFDGDEAHEVERFDMGQRIREVEQTPDGGLLVLEDDPGGRLLRVTPTY